MKKGLLFVIATGLVIGVWSSTNSSNDSCVNLYVDYGQLDNNTKLTTCVDTSTKTNALEVLKEANLQIEGTKKYGNGVICRVNGLPNETVESCEVMPPAEAYWAIIIKEKQVIPFPRKEWGWGQLAIDQQYLNPGDSIGLVWTGPKGELKFP
jgi:hypothetical protein